MQEQVAYRSREQQYGVELVDAHCHLELFNDYKIAVADARMAGIRWMITAGGNRSSSMAAASIADGKNVVAVMGIDPSAPIEDGSFVPEIAQIIRSNKNIVGIGEIGLDYKLAKVDKEYQTKLFIQQIAIAKELDVPIVIHARGAIADVIEIVEKEGVKKAMFHFFEGDEIQAKRLAERGYLISIPPIESSRRKRVINALDISSIVVETDSPVVGKAPEDVIKTVGWIAQIKGLDFKDAAQAITQNVKKLFNI